MGKLVGVIPSNDDDDEVYKYMTLSFLKKFKTLKNCNFESFILEFFIRASIAGGNLSSRYVFITVGKSVESFKNTKNIKNKPPVCF